MDHTGLILFRLDFNVAASPAAESAMKGRALFPERPTCMPHYLLSVQDGDQVTHVTLDLADDRAAGRQALIHTARLIDSRPSDAWLTQDWSIVVLTEGGGEIIRFYFQRGTGPS